MSPADAFELGAGFKSVNLSLGIRALIVALAFAWTGWVVVGEYRLWAAQRSTSDQMIPAIGFLLVFLILLTVFID